MNVKKITLEYDREGREIEVIREGEQIDTARFKELSRTERFTGKKKQSIARF